MNGSMASCILDVKSDRVMVVGTNPTKLQQVKIAMDLAGFNVEFGTQEQARERALVYSAYLLDVESLGASNAIDLCRDIKKLSCSTEAVVIILLNDECIHLKEKVLNCGANDFVNSSKDHLEIALRLTQQLRQRTLHLSLYESNQLMVNELEDARSLLTSLLPSEETLRELGQQYQINIGSHYQPSSILGGDFYDAFPIQDDKLGFYLWDFSGHGISAAINTLRLNSTIYNYQDLSENPGLFITNINNALTKISKQGFYATMFYGVLDKSNRTMSYAFASCPAPILISSKRKDYKLIETREFPLGVVEGHVFETHSIDLKPWDALVLYSDALIETESSKDGNFLPEEKLAQMAIEALQDTNTNAGNIKNRIMTEFYNSYQKNLRDDLTLKVIHLP